MRHSPPQDTRYISRKERLALVGQIANELAHSLNNSLNAMQLRLSLLREEMHNPELTNHVDNLSRIVSDTAARIGVLQEFIARGITPVEGVNVREVLEAAAELIHQTNTRTTDETRVMLKLPSDLPEVRGARSDLVSMFVVLIRYLLESHPSSQSGIMIIGKQNGERVIIELIQHSPEPLTSTSKRVFDPFAALADSPLAVSLLAMQNLLKQFGGSVSIADRQDHRSALTVELACATTAPR